MELRAMSMFNGFKSNLSPNSDAEMNLTLNLIIMKLLVFSLCFLFVLCGPLLIVNTLLYFLYFVNEDFAH